VSNVADLRFAFKSGVLSIVEAIKNEEPPPEEGMQDWLEEKFQSFYRTYSQLQMMLGGIGGMGDVQLPEEKQ
jgi:hypothetical protein